MTRRKEHALIQQETADAFLLEEARSNRRAVILSNDRFQDYAEEYPDILVRNRRVEPGMMLNDKIYFPNLKLAIPVRHAAIRG